MSLRCGNLLEVNLIETAVALGLVTEPRNEIKACMELADAVCELQRHAILAEVQVVRLREEEGVRIQAACQEKFAAARAKYPFLDISSIFSSLEMEEPELFRCDCDHVDAAGHEEGPEEPDRGPLKDEGQCCNFAGVV